MPTATRSTRSLSSVDFADDVALQTDGLTGVINARPQGGVRPILDEVAVRQIAETDAAAASGGIVSGDRELQRFGGDRACPDAVALRTERQVDDRQVDLSISGVAY